MDLIKVKNHNVQSFTVISFLMNPNTFYTNKNTRIQTTTEQKNSTKINRATLFKSVTPKKKTLFKRLADIIRHHVHPQSLTVSSKRRIISLI